MTNFHKEKVWECKVTAPFFGTIPSSSFSQLCCHFGTINVLGILLLLTLVTKKCNGNVRKARVNVGLEKAAGLTQISVAAVSWSVSAHGTTLGPCRAHKAPAPALELAAAARLLRNFTFLPTAAAGCAPPSPDSRPHTQPPSVWERPRREDHPVTTSSSQVQYNFYSQRGQPNPTQPASISR